MLQQFIYSSIYWTYLFLDHLYSALFYWQPVSLSACKQKGLTPPHPAWWPQLPWRTLVIAWWHKAQPEAIKIQVLALLSGKIFWQGSQSWQRNGKTSLNSVIQLLQLPLSSWSVITHLFPGKGMLFSIHCYKTTTPLAGLPVAFSVQVEDKSYYMCCERERGEMTIRFKVRIHFPLLICTNPTGRINNWNRTDQGLCWD